MLMQNTMHLQYPPLSKIIMAEAILPSASHGRNSLIVLDQIFFNSQFYE